MRHIILCQSINSYHQGFIRKYKEIKLQILSDDPKLVSDNGLMTQILNHKKFFKSITYWIGKQQQWEYRNLKSVFFHSKNKGQIVGRVNKKQTHIQGTSALFNNKYQVVISTYKNGKPSGWTITYLDCLENKVKYSIFDRTGKETIYYEGHTLLYVKDLKLLDDGNSTDYSTRKNRRFTGPLKNGEPFIGVHTYEKNGGTYKIEG